MVFEITRPTESCELTANTERKRLQPVPQTTEIAIQTEAKRPCPPPQAAPKVENNGWGPIFKNRETFLEMHIC